VTPTSRAEIADIDEVIVSLGGGYAAEREEEGAISSLETKKDTIDERIEELQAQVSELDSEAERSRTAGPADATAADAADDAATAGRAGRAGRRVGQRCSTD